MRILLTLFEIQDYGGIVGDIEYLAKGFREHGHECDLVLLRCNDRDPYLRKPEGPAGSYPSIFGGTVNTLHGWYGIEVLGYGSARRISALHRLMESYDLVIHEIPNPKPDEEGWWRQIYAAQVPQIIAAHDAHYRDMYPHIAEIADKIVAITCTNHAGYVALEHFPAPRAFIGAAHELQPWVNMIPWGQRPNSAVCAHVWKAWKKMDRVVRAGPLLDRTILVMGGDGIEGRYMRSKDKCKPRYKGIWDTFISSPHCFYAGLMTNEQLFAVYQASRVMVDMSFSDKFYRLGNHFNRSILEAANCGAISICTIENMRENNPQVPLFVDGITHIGVPEDATPGELAETIDWAVNDVLPQRAEEMVWNVRIILADHFDYRVTSLQYLELAKGKPAGIYPVLETGKNPNAGKGLAATPPHEL